ncbi:MAG: outer membrane beta-barrel protein [Gemmatimonadales bacterium]
MRTRFAVTSLIVVLGLAAAQSAEAQRRRGLVDVTPRSDRHGFWMNVGVGAGTESSRLEPETSYTSGLTKPVFSFRLGGTVNPYLRLGGELTGWTDRHYDADLDNNVTSYVGGAFLIGQFYPSPRAGLFFKGGLGITRSGENPDGPDDLHEDGFGYTVGAGYEVQLSRSLYITPTVDFLKHRSQIRDLDGTLLPPLHDRVVSFGVALTIQPGR